MWTHVGPRNCVLGLCLDPSNGKGNFFFLGAAMQPFIKILGPFVFCVAGRRCQDAAKAENCKERTKVSSTCRCQAMNCQSETLIINTGHCLNSSRWIFRNIPHACVSNMWFRKKLQNLSVVFIGQSSSYARLSVGAVVVNFLQLDTDNKKQQHLTACHKCVAWHNYLYCKNPDV